MHGTSLEAPEIYFGWSDSPQSGWRLAIAATVSDVDGSRSQIILVLAAAL